MTATPAGADVVVVGAGSAGCALARRLVERGLRVVVLEAGGEDTNPDIGTPGRLAHLWFAEEDWAYHTVAQPHAGHRRLHWPRGRVLGGSSALNGMIWARGAAADYDHWAYLGNDGWSWTDVLPVHRRMEDLDAVSPLRGTGGPIHVMSQYRPDAIFESCIKAAQEIGVGINPDYNSGELDGVSQTQLTIRDGQRQSAAVGYLRPILGHPGLTVVTRAHARRLLFTRDRCTGVEWKRDGLTHTTHADVEVIVSAGTIESPRLLMLSGIGDAAELRRHDIDVRVHLPGVGRNLHDHLLSPVIFSTARQVGRSPDLSPMQSHLFWRTRSGLPVPDVQALHFPVPMYQPGMSGPSDGFTLQAGLVRPVSRGRISLVGDDPHAGLDIDPAALACAQDVDALVEAVILCREMGAGSALAGEWGAREVYPGSTVRTPDDLRAYVRATAGTFHHQVGTCKMGADDQAVVDARLRVRGVRGLRVADASIMPAVTTANTHAPAVLIGELAADFVTAGQHTGQEQS
ncbi:GMC family oxidoreductase [Micromonospora rubida]|uniref:GMC family oxidoreductase n=1 Tax=Micromonospora rubida TaxID=2697657 RepID=UPI00137749A8|nr:FAD-dependent oxidoreductase [Micromonospora rubida]NBE84164.1 FAD-binding protein [Micromonospora rubida]